jgi:hypothetical protein
MNHDESGGLISAKIGIAVGGATIAGYTLNEVVTILTGLYVIFQLILILPRMASFIRGWYRWFRGTHQSIDINKDKP